MNINSNKGMYIENLVEKTISFYISNKLCFIEKRYLPIQIVKKLDHDMIVGKLIKKSFVDYIGIVEGKYISFETKQTNMDEFNLNQIKEHQLKFLSLISQLNGISFLILHFYCHDKTFLISFLEIEKWLSKKRKKVTLDFLNDLVKQNRICELKIVFPGILDILEQIKNLIH